MSAGGVASAMRKIAEEKYEEPGWFDRQRAAYRARRAGDSGLDLILPHEGLAGKATNLQVKGALRGLGVGGLAGGALGAVAGGGKGILPGAIIGGALGSHVGGTAGLMEAERAHLAERGITPTWGGLDYGLTPEAVRKYHLQKKSGLSVREAVALFDELATGQYGEDVTAALEGALLSRIPHVKAAAAEEEAIASESDSESRKRRLAELLRKREATGTATGSASPNPPKGE